MTVNLDKTAENVVQLLNSNKLTAATAESCTGGMISAALVGVSGASEVFGFGVCTYANEAKMKLLGVKEDTLASVGAVSEETACQMAEGVRKLAGSDIGIATTGIAGPAGGSAEKPVGTVWIGVSSAKGTSAKRYVFDGKLFPEESEKRQAIRKEAAYTALMTVINEIERK